MKGHSKLKSIQIRNLGVIESSSLDFKEGFTVLTGETGAGKTMVLTALNLILGGKADGKLVRNGSERLIVSAEFEIDKTLTSEVEDLGGIVEDGILILTRSVSSDGKSKATLGGVSVPTSILTSLGEKLIEIHAQSSSGRLNKESVQRELLDQYASNSKFLNNYQNALAEFNVKKMKLAELKKANNDRENQIERLNEISKLAKKYELSHDVYYQIENEISRLESVEDLNRLLTLTLEVFESDELNLTAALRQAEKSLTQATSLDKELQIYANEFRDGLRSIEIAASDLRAYRDKLSADPARFDYLQNRKAELIGLVKKYGSNDDRNLSINKLFEESRSATSRIEELTGGDELIAELSKDLKNSFDTVANFGIALAKNRQEFADKISKEIGEELRELALPNAQIIFGVFWPEVPSEKDLAPTGIDSIEINFASHSSSKLAPLSKSASGGELSRVMLAIEVVLSSASEIGTFIFDEVDAGVGGKAAIDVGRKLLSIAQSSQVIVVTHLAQVAVWANHHFAITKSEAGDFVESSVSLLTGESRRTEIARLLSGQDESESALEHAGELLEMASKKALR